MSDPIFKVGLYLSEISDKHGFSRSIDSDISKNSTSKTGRKQIGFKADEETLIISDL